MDLAPLLADFGFAPRTAFLSELGFRLRNKLLPGTPDTTHPAELFSLLFPTGSDVRWIAALPPSLLQRLHDTLFTSEGEHHPVAPQPALTGTGHDQWEQALADAILFSVSQVSATGFAAEIRVRMSAQALRGRACLELSTLQLADERAVSVHGAQSGRALLDAQALLHTLAFCAAAVNTV